MLSTLDIHQDRSGVRPVHRFCRHHVMYHFKGVEAYAMAFL